MRNMWEIWLSKLDYEKVIIKLPRNCYLSSFINYHISREYKSTAKIFWIKSLKRSCNNVSRRIILHTFTHVVFDWLQQTKVEDARDSK